MKFTRPKTEKSKKRLIRVFYFTYATGPLSGMSKLLSENFDEGLVLWILKLLSSLLGLFHFAGIVVLLALYIMHIFIEGLEKPQFTYSKGFISK